MEDKGIAGDAFSYNICLNVYASIPDVKEMEKLLLKMEKDPMLIKFNSYVVATKGYMKAGNPEKASKVLKRCEHLIKGKNERLANETLLTLYDSMGKKNDVYRIWKKLKNRGKVYISSYLCVMRRLENLDDIDGAEKIFSEWEANRVYFDIRVPNFLIAIYCKNGHLEKAESITERLLESGLMRRNYMALGYCSHYQMEKAFETLKKAILASVTRWKPRIRSWATCVNYLQSNGDAKREKEIKRLLEE
ncbi:hypothetical protein K7X08_015270 [Anisodus acutangulus]|uniref:Pentatricopeptide repeat-containing protein n=1 Tax=Anisodus acutangulus TaxID=402998 RepID=A0A9Q1QTG1_9SOLA|nr:hypothetical protein K7X08_015270 [Anisodus acutangulus]